MLNFDAGERVVVQGEPATFFGVVLQGSLTVTVDDQDVGIPPRGEGELIGEMSLFNGGLRTASMAGGTEGYLAVVQFSKLERLKRTNEPLATKLSQGLAIVVLERQLPAEGLDLADLSDEEVQRRLRALLLKAEEQRWDQSDPKQQESLLKRAKKGFVKKKKQLVGASLLTPLKLERTGSSLSERLQSADPSPIAELNAVDEEQVTV